MICCDKTIDRTLVQDETTVTYAKSASPHLAGFTVCGREIALISGDANPDRSDGDGIGDACELPVVAGLSARRTQQGLPGLHT